MYTQDQKINTTAISSAIEVANQEARKGIAQYELPKLTRWLMRKDVADKNSDQDKQYPLAKRLILRKLSLLSNGVLEAKDGEETYSFGSSQNGQTEPVQIIVHSQHVYQRMMFNGVLGAAEAYMEGEWTTPDLVSVIQFFSQNIDELQAVNAQRSVFNRAAMTSLSWLHRNTLQRSKKNISAHYDLGNDFFSLFLDPTMLYSSAIYEREDMSLEQASVAKLDRLCRKLDLKPSDHLLEIGTGWGAMAVYAAQTYGCKVTTTTISEEQYQYANALVKQLGLDKQVAVLKKDYRDLEGSYDKLVSIEMIEAVGHQFFQQYFQVCSKLLKPHGAMAIQAITIPDQRFTQAAKNVDFIKRYIFPGGCLPSLGVITKHIAKDTDMVIADVADITQHYATTLATWRKSFFEQIDQVRQQGFDERFIRMWDYYLCYCEGGFKERIIGTHQIVFHKPGYRY